MKVAILVMALALSACATHHRAGDGRAPSIAGEVQEGVFECYIHGAKDKHDCKNVPIVVLVKYNPDGSTKGCFALVPYLELRVHTKDSNGTDHLTWKITPPGYEFSPNNLGFDGVTLTDDPSHNLDKVWKREGRPGKDTYKMTLLKGAPPSRFNHSVRVNEIGGSECLMTDPVISNDGGR